MIEFYLGLLIGFALALIFIIVWNNYDE